MGVMLQAFYWDCPKHEGCEGTWYKALAPQLPALAADGFSALWLPPASKAAAWIRPLRLFRPGRIRPEGQD